MKKLICLLLALVLCVVCVVSSLAAQEKLGAVGNLTKLGIEEGALNKILAGASFKDTPYTGLKYYDTLNSMTAALNSGEVAAITLDEYTYKYLLSRTGKVVSIKTPEESQNHVIEGSYVMLLRDDDKELCSRISEAIAGMKSDGTLDALKVKYIDECIAGADPEPVSPDVFDGAETIRVALTGDRPPMDYFNAAGQPAGFNTALVSEIAKRMKVNVLFISIDSGARAVSLASKRADVVFWSELNNFDNWEHSHTEDQPENTVITEAYAKCRIVDVVLQTSPLAPKSEE